MTTTKQLSLNYNLLKPKSNWFLTTVILLLYSFSLTAQVAKTVQGSVTSAEDGVTLPGVNVLVKGTNTGTSTDFNGFYSINATPTDILVFSYLGFESQEVTVGNETQINLQLTESLNALDEIVVIGYGTQRKSDLTGSVAVVDVDEAKKTVTYDVAKMLQGQVPGVTVQSSGEPGSFVNIKIRGVTSFTNNNPLFVIDGMIVNDPYDFAPGEIESIQVLKDASSAAIYGQRGANGVIIITTKKGKEGKVAVNYKSILGFQTIPNKLSLTNRVEYQEITSQAELNAGLDVVPGNDPDSNFFINDVDTDWQDAAYKTGILQNHALTFSGGAENINYSLNLDYFGNTA